MFSPCSLHAQGSNVIMYGKEAKKPESCNEERHKKIQKFVRMEMRKKHLL